jgi:ankyrin repeat protein
MNPDKFLIDMAEIGDTEAVRYALDHGANVNDNYALQCASNNDHTETVKVLLDYGADVHAYDNYALKKASHITR